MDEDDLCGYPPVLEVLPGEVGEGCGHADAVLHLPGPRYGGFLRSGDGEPALAEPEVQDVLQLLSCLGGDILPGDPEVHGPGIYEDGYVLGTDEEDLEVQVGDLYVELPSPVVTKVDAGLRYELDGPLVEPALVRNGHFYRHVLTEPQYNN